MRLFSFNKWLMVVFAVAVLVGIGTFGMAQESQTALKSYVDSIEKSQEGMTLWDMIQAGGFIMAILAVFSVGTIALVFYNFLAVKEKKLVPHEFADNVIQKLEKRDASGVKEMCQNRDNIIASIVLAGLDKKKRGDIFAKEAMENQAKKEVSGLWQSISFLADIAAIAPLIGLLGTVLGMIQAFNVIAFQTAVVKPILLAGGVSKAMVTTAGGLIVAIPAMFFYTYFRSRVQRISNSVESYSADIIKLVSEL